MKSVLKLIGLVLLLNVIRYLVAGPLEAGTIMSPMHQPMIDFPDCFNNSFTTFDWTTSFAYNYMVWFCATWVFYIAHHQVTGSMIVRSFKIYGIMWLFFVSLSAVYMNHYVDGIKVFYKYGMLDAILTFSIVALANGLLFPRIFKAA